VSEFIDTRWVPVAQAQRARLDAGLTVEHRLALLPNVSRRSDRLKGPLQGMLVDG